MYKKIELDNGLHIILNHMPSMESATIGIWINAGSRNENARVSGISHFLEHLLFKGTPTRGSRKIKEEIEGRGGSLNGFTSEDVTCYLAKVSGQHVDVALDVLSDMVLNASLAKKDIARERSVIIEEIKMYRDLPNHHVHDILSEMMWPRHSLGRTITGSIKSVSSITRQNLLDYKNKNYSPANITVVLCGNIESDSSVRKIKKIFGRISEKKTQDPVRFSNRQASPQLKILYKETEQSRLSMGMHTFGRMHRDRYALSLLHIILGANMSSRLFENVREKRGLAYQIGTEIEKHKETGAFIVNAGIDHKNVKETSGLIIKELVEIKNKVVSSSELKRAKEFLKIQLLLALEDTLDHMIWLGDYAVATGKLPDKKDIIKKANAVSRDDLQRVARDIFNKKNLNLALIGPIKDRERHGLEQRLGEL
ncbi:MAG: insulinase family protein [Candidatus Omnitrophica bacterium]|nr:insulinase family protein [Candidatus Omnitrophota bacterium]MBU4589567.1 insulinase family protein [Candidatus Omnitrophota bacterium]